MTRLLLLSSFLLFTGVTNAQYPADSVKTEWGNYLSSASSNSTSATQETGFTPNVLPPAPNAAALGKYGDIPVNNYTGSASTSVPIYTIQEGELNIPISLSYHHGGIMVDEEASVVGLGWSLNAGGAITRTVRGIDDFANNGTEGYGCAFNKPVSDYKEGITESAIGYFANKINGQFQNPPLDTEPDIFYFNVNGKSGKFILSSDNSEADLLPGGNGIEGILLSPSDMQVKCVSRIGTNRNNHVYTWEIIDESGNKYIFNVQERTASVSIGVNLPNSRISNGFYQGGSMELVATSFKANNIISSWYISKIKSANSNREINFVYTTANNYYSTSRLRMNERYGTNGGTGVACNSQVLPFPPDRMGRSSSTSLQIFNNIYLAEITFSTGKVQFSLQDRDDIQPYSNLATTYPNLPFSDISLSPSSLVSGSPDLTVPKKIGGINLKSNTGSLVKSWGFDQSYFNEGVIGTTFNSRSQSEQKYNNLRLRLDGIRQLAVQSSVLTGDDLELYRFTYEGDILDENLHVITPTALPSKVSQARDYWGYYNGQNGNNAKSLLIPSISFPKMAINESSPNVFQYILSGVGHTDDFDGAGACNREVNVVSKKLGLLKNIFYPTGGHTEFQYESHEALDENPYFNTSSYEVGLNDAPVTFNTSFNGGATILAKIELELECISINSAPANCNQPANSSSPGWNDWFAKLSGSNGYVLERKYSKWVQKSSEQIVVNGQPATKYYYREVLENVQLAPSTSYTLETFRDPNRTNFAKPKLKVTAYSYETNPRIVELGGLRIKKTVNFDESGDKVVENQVLYENENGSKSGIQMKRLRSYTFGYEELIKIVKISQGLSNVALGTSCYWGLYLESNFITPLGTSAGGSHIGYSDVITKDVGINGSSLGQTHFKYVNYTDSPTSSHLFADIPSAPNTSNGMLLKNLVYNNEGILVKKTISSEPVEKVSHSINNIWGMKYYIGNQLQSGGSSIVTVTKAAYNIPVKFWYQPTTTETTYDENGNNPISKTQTMAYDSPNHLQVTSMTTQDSRGRDIITLYKYPIDYYYTSSNIIYSEMHNKYIRTPIIEETVKIGGSNKQISRKLSEYKKVGNLYYLPLKISTQLGVGDPLVEQVNFMNYNSNGYLTSYVSKEIKTDLQWFSSGVNIGLIQSKSVAPIILDPLSPTMVTTFQYQPLLGLSSQTEPNGLTNSYLYDNLGRLLFIKNNNGDYVKSYQYGLKGSSD